MLDSILAIPLAAFIVVGIAVAGLIARGMYREQARELLLWKREKWHEKWANEREMRNKEIELWEREQWHRDREDKDD